MFNVFILNIIFIFNLIVYELQLTFYYYKFTTYYNFINIQLVLNINNIDISG